MSSIRFLSYPLVGLDSLFDDAFSAHPSRCTSSTEGCRGRTAPLNPFRPKLDLHESKDSNVVTATFELPGLKPEDVTIELLRNRLTVSGESGTSNSREEGGYAVRERSNGRFSRMLQLPFGTKPEDVTAKLENGVLTVTFPKDTPEQQPQRIVVQ